MYSDKMYDLFGELAKLAAIYELRLRLLADKSKKTKNVSMSKNLEDVEKEVFVYFDIEITSKEKEFLSACRKLRNKLFHAEFSKANAILEEVCGITAPDIVKQIKLQPDASGEQILEKIFACAEGREQADSVLGTTEKESSIFGWLLQIYNSGVLSLSLDVFGKSINVIDRLIDLNKND